MFARRDIVSRPCGFNGGWKLPPSYFGVYPLRTSRRDDAFDRLVYASQAWLVGSCRAFRLGSVSRIVQLVNQLGEDTGKMKDEEIRVEMVGLQYVLRKTGCSDRKAVARCFALVREASERVLGKRHYDVQLMAGYALLRGMVAEMGTGEGKTLSATLCAIAGAVAGWPVHVISVNDYLTERDATTMGPLYEFFGLTVDKVTSGMQFDERRSSYGCDITYCTSKELAFDYLRDRVVLGEFGTDLRLRAQSLGVQKNCRSDQLRLRGLHFGIVDEADSVLIDEARTPLLISKQGDGALFSSEYRKAVEIGDSLHVERDFRVRDDERNVFLTKCGMKRVKR